MEFKHRVISKRNSTAGWLNYLSWCLGILVCLLLFVQVMVSNRLATTGYQISRIEVDIENTNSENEQLREKIASASAFTTLKAKAQALGFTKSVSPAFFSRDLPVALSK